MTVNAPDYSESDMELVNVAGFKVPYIVREYWKVECRKKRVNLSPILKAFLVDEFGLPPGFDLEDLLNQKPENGCFAWLRSQRKRGELSRQLIE